MLRLVLALLLFASIAAQATPAYPEESGLVGADSWSSALERFLARRYTHWQTAHAGRDAEPDRQFIIVCDPENLGSFIRSLRQLSTLRDAYSGSPKRWGAAEDSQYPCIGTNSFRLPRLPWSRSVQPSDDDDPGALGAFYEVVQDDPVHQVVGLRFRDLNTGILDSFFKYEVRAGTVVPLESWVLSRGVIPMLIVELTFVSLLLLLMASGMFGLFGFLRRRRRRIGH
jgi:hypothetical protein